MLYLFHSNYVLSGFFYVEEPYWFFFFKLKKFGLCWEKIILKWLKLVLKAVWALLFQFKWANVSLIRFQFFLVKVRWSKILWCWGHLHLHNSDLALPVEIKPEPKVTSHSSGFAYITFELEFCCLAQFIFSFPRWLVSTRSAIWRLLLECMSAFFTCIEQLISPSHNYCLQKYLFINMSKTTY